MDLRVRVLISVLLVAGSFLAAFVWARSRPATEAERAAQVRQDAESLLPAISPKAGNLPELNEEFWAAWDKRRALYDPEQLAELRSRLLVYLDFIEAEHADAAEVWTSGNRAAMSDAARAARKRLREAFGNHAEALVEDAERLREQAYVASPRVAGLDPDLPRYDRVKQEVLAVLPELRRRVEQLTEPL